MNEAVVAAAGAVDVVVVETLEYEHAWRKRASCLDNERLGHIGYQDVPTVGRAHLR